MTDKSDTTLENIDTVLEALPEGCTFRELREEDIPALADLKNAIQQMLVGEDYTNIEHLTQEMHEPAFTMATDARVIFRAGRLVAYAECFNMEPYVSAWATVEVHPDHLHDGLEPTLLDWVEARAKLDLHKAPEGARVVVKAGTLEQHTHHAAMLTGHGYAVARHFYRMVIDLDEEPAEPTWPAEITAVRAMAHTEDDLRATYATVKDAFKDHYGYVERDFEVALKNWRAWVENDPNFTPELFRLAMAGDEIAGFSLNWPGLPGDPDLGWIGTLGVRRQYRRRGLGRALLLHSFRELYKIGKRTVGLGVDADSLTGAVKLYTDNGMRIARRTDHFEKEIRPGVNLVKK